jgi:hypothetical protein
MPAKAAQIGWNPQAVPSPRPHRKARPAERTSTTRTNSMYPRARASSASPSIRPSITSCDARSPTQATATATAVPRSPRPSRKAASTPIARYPATYSATRAANWFTPRSRNIVTWSRGKSGECAAKTTSL